MPPIFQNAPRLAIRIPHSAIHVQRRPSRFQVFLPFVIKLIFKLYLSQIQNMFFEDSTGYFSMVSGIALYSQYACATIRRIIEVSIFIAAAMEKRREYE